jgi:pentatricopeptide repeat protein
LKGYLDEAIDEYKEAIFLDPELASAYNHLANAYAKQERYDEALELFENALKQDPNFPYSYIGLASIFDIMGDYRKAITHYREALAHSPDRSFSDAIEDRIRTLEEQVEPAEPAPDDTICPQTD